MKHIASIVLCVVLPASLVRAQSAIQDPAGIQAEARIERSVRADRSEKLDLILQPTKPQMVRDTSRGTFLLEKKNTLTSLGELAAMSYQDMVTVVAGLKWSDIDGLFTYSTHSYTFYRDENRVQYLIDEVYSRAAQFTAADDKGIPTLIEVIRSGFFLGYYNSQLGYLNDDAFHARCLPGMKAMVHNSSFGLGTAVQDELVKALGLYIANAKCDPQLLNNLVPVLQQFNAGFNEWKNDYAKPAAVYTLANGIHYDIYWNNIHTAPDPGTLPFYNRIDDFLEEIYDLALFGDLNHNAEYLINNAVYWTGQLSSMYQGPRPLEVLTQVMSTYGEWPMASVEAARQIDARFGGVDYNGGVVDFDLVRTALHAQLLPNTVRYDEGSIIIIYGGAVSPVKLQKLYWAQKEVRSHYYRLAGRDEPLESGNADDSLTIVIYNSPDEYSFNTILYGLSTNNGGMYIERDGTFFTYERTPQQSIYTLEDLFRHEFTHYCQGRFQEPGFWGDSPLYDNDRTTWIGEGQAEFYAGSSRLGGVKTRKAMVTGIASSAGDRYTLPDVLEASYASGFTFYTYAFACVDYFYTYRPDILLELTGRLQSGDAEGFTNYVNQLKADSELDLAYRNHMQDLKDNADSFTDPVTSDAYVMAWPFRADSSIISDIVSISGISAMTTTAVNSATHKALTIEGKYTLGSSQGKADDWAAMNRELDRMLTSLSDLSWGGYQTYTAWFTDYRVVNGEAEYSIVFHGLATENDPAVHVGPVAGHKPDRFELLPAYPNPFNSSTAISFTLPRAADVTLQIYNALGEAVAVIADKTMLSAGQHTYIWNGRDDRGEKAASGTYFYTMVSRNYIATKKMVLMK